MTTVQKILKLKRMTAACSKESCMGGKCCAGKCGGGSK